MKRCLPLLLLGLCLLLPPAARAEDNPAPLRRLPNLTVLDLASEHYAYSLDFLWFKRLATGAIGLTATDQPDVFEAELLGQTLGLASWLTGDRSQRYRARMQLMPDGRLRSLDYTSEIKKRKWGEWRNKGKHYHFDYERRKVSLEKGDLGAFKFDKEFDLPETGEPVDFLTAFYNLRLGVYGVVEQGAQFTIPTFSGRGVNEIKVEVLTTAAQAKEDFFPSEGILLRVKVDPEIFDTSSGDLFVWFNNFGAPIMGIVEDIIGMGDVRGYLEVPQHAAE